MNVERKGLNSRMRYYLENWFLKFDLSAFISHSEELGLGGEEVLSAAK